MPAAAINSLLPLRPGAGAAPPPGGLAANLVSYYEFSGGWSDSTANHNDLAGSGGPSYSVTGILGTAAGFNPATNAYLDTYTLNGWNILAGDSWEWQGWVYANTLAADMVIAGYNVGADVLCWEIRYAAVANRFQLTVGTTSIQSGLIGTRELVDKEPDPRFGSSSDPTIQTWYFLSAGQNAGSMFLSVNNGGMATAPRVNNPTGAPWSLTYGVYKDLSSLFWNGRVDQTGYWAARSLTTPQRTYCYNGGLARSYADISTANP